MLDSSSIEITRGQGLRELDAPELSLVVPTRNEANNVAELLRRLRSALTGHSFEVVFVDDSDDDTCRAIDRAVLPGDRISVIRRPSERRGCGLGSAVVEGLAAAGADWVCVMDADLQHPPEVVGRLLQRSRAGDVDVVVASRFCGDGDVGDFGRGRCLVSKLSTASAALLFPGPLAAVSDPLSGFFLVRRSALQLEHLRPTGFKILLEILVRSARLRVAEVPFEFGRRVRDDSKAGAIEGLRYVRQLWRLRVGTLASRFGRFGAVGLTGLVVNTVLLALLVDAIGIGYLLAALLATQGSTLWNFALTERLVFGERVKRRSLTRRCALFLAVNNAALVLRVPLLWALASGVGLHYLLANVVSLVALTILRFGLSDGWIWAAPPAPARVHAYDVHGIVTIASEVRLPELERFAVDVELPAPTIGVRIAAVPARAAPSVPFVDGDLVSYVERFGRCGFGVEIEMDSQHADVVASPLLRHSPHVLYTNVVEPVLRWSFVERGYALVHAACLASDGHGVLITARTDTGKTTTALKTLDSGSYAFLSDDLTLISPDGRLLSYPKPLTISRHTLTAVRTPLLSRRERAALVVQSRLHSKSGRLLGMLIARAGLPAATMNALVQWLVPPPKYQVDRLVPGVGIASEAEPVALAIIQREQTSWVRLDGEEAVEILMRNCEDAYGFPPYPLVERFFHSRGGRDLKARERAIVEAALRDVPATLLNSPTRDWHPMLAVVLEEGIDGHALAPALRRPPPAAPPPVAGRAEPQPAGGD